VKQGKDIDELRKVLLKMLELFPKYDWATKGAFEEEGVDRAWNDTDCLGEFDDHARRSLDADGRIPRY
jgi:hypothetical protein